MAAYSGVQSMSWSIGPIVAGSALVGLVGVLAGEKSGVPKPPVAAYTSAWLVTFIVLGILMAGMALWHSAFLPQGSRTADASKTLGDGVRLFGRVFVTFFQKKDVWKLIGFAFFYRFGLGLLDKVSVQFLLASRDTGGLGLDNSKLAILNGIAAGAFIVGSLVGGWFVAKRGLKRSLLILCLLLNVPNVTFLYLGWARPESIYIIGLIFCIAKLGWAIVAVGHMVCMMQQIAPGRRLVSPGDERERRRKRDREVPPLNLPYSALMGVMSRSRMERIRILLLRRPQIRESCRFFSYLALATLKSNLVQPNFRRASGRRRYERACAALAKRSPFFPVRSHRRFFFGKGASDEQPVGRAPKVPP
jgi:hypothetical protein